MSLVITDVETGAITYRDARAHLHAISTLSSYAEGMCATGDEEGLVKLWDMRTNKNVSTIDEHEDWVSDFAYNGSNGMSRDEFVTWFLILYFAGTLISVAADGVLVAFQTRGMKVAGMSYSIDDELLSVMSFLFDCNVNIVSHFQDRFNC
jgi:WD40 repeat protein